MEGIKSNNTSIKLTLTIKVDNQNSKKLLELKNF